MEVHIDQAVDLEIPVIRVVDWDEEPPLATWYFSGNNELEFMAVYAKVKRLTDHAGRGRLEMYMQDGNRKLRLKECDSAFMHSFWECVANLIDYFADFCASDTGAMQSLWAHLLDVLQEAAELPHHFWELHYPKCSHSQVFAQFYEQSLDIIQTLINDKKLRSSDATVYPNDSLASSIEGRLGGFRTGLASWQQFLYAGGPGFNVRERRFSKSAKEPKGFDVQQYIPQGGLAILKTHTERARALVVKHSKDPEEVAEFDRSSLKMSDEAFTYTSTDSREHSVLPIFPTPMTLRCPSKKPGLSDPDMLRDRPDLNLVDEAMGNCKGSQAFVGAYGTDRFTMWLVSSKNKPSLQQSQVESNEEGLSNFFDEWV